MSSHKRAQLGIEKLDKVMKRLLLAAGHFGEALTADDCAASDRRLLREALIGTSTAVKLIEELKDRLSKRYAKEKK